MVTCKDSCKFQSLSKILRIGYTLVKTCGNLIFFYFYELFFFTFLFLCSLYVPFLILSALASFLLSSPSHLSTRKISSRFPPATLTHSIDANAKTSNFCHILEFILQSPVIKNYYHTLLSPMTSLMLMRRKVVRVW